MDTVKFVTSHIGEGRHAVPAVEPFVNGIALKELAKAVELPHATADGQPDLAGSYAGLVEEVVWPSRHFLGEPAFHWFGDGDTVLLGCVCGEWGCWPLTATVDVSDSTVHWHGFRNGHREWDLGALGPFVFDRVEYERALGQAPTS